jgi:hypothetical protein
LYLARTTSHRAARVDIFALFSVLTAAILLISLFGAGSILQPGAATLSRRLHTGPPLAFVPNLGQTNPTVHFQARGLGGALFFAPDGVMFALPTNMRDQGSGVRGQTTDGRRTTDDGQRTTDNGRRTTVHGQLTTDNRPRTTDHRQLTTDHITLRFEGANAEAVIEAGAARPGKTHVFNGNDPAAWRTNLPSYADITYRQLYDGIDLQYTGADGLLKETYYVAPHADPSRIRWSYTGAEDVRVDPKSNDLLINLPTQGDKGTRRQGDEERRRPGDGGAYTIRPHATLSEQAPVAWQDIQGRRIPVEVHYKLLDSHSSKIQNPKSKIQNPLVGFALGAYDPSHPLIIDPTIAYSSFLGGAGGDGSNDIAIDAAGNIYLTGWTASSAFPGTQGSPHNTDAFVTKLSPDGRTILYSAYLGGSGYESGTGIAVDATGNVYITGITFSSNFPVTGAYQDKKKGGSDVFVTKLGPNGRTLIYSTYLGGNNEDEAADIALNTFGNAFVTGSTFSSNFPTNKPLQKNPTGDADAFVTKVSQDGRNLAYSTYLGGGGSDVPNSIAIDPVGNAYITGGTTSPDFPLKNALKPEFTAAENEAFVSKINDRGEALVYSTFLGGSDGQSGFAIAVDGAGSAYVTGSTSSADFPVVNALQPALNIDCGAPTCVDAFVTRLSVDGATLAYSSYLGGKQTDVGKGIALDSAGHFYITGYTQSLDFPVANPVQPGKGGSDTTCGSDSRLTPCADAFVTKFAPTGTALVYSTYLGGAANDFGEEIALDASGGAHLTGYTVSADFPRVHPLQDTFRGDEFTGDGFIAKIADDTSTATPTPTTSPTIDPGAPTPTPDPAVPTPTASPTGGPGPEPQPGARVYLPILVEGRTGR